MLSVRFTAVSTSTSATSSLASCSAAAQTVAHQQAGPKWMCGACSGTVVSPNPLYVDGGGDPKTLQFASPERCEPCRFQHHLFGKPSPFKDRHAFYCSLVSMWRGWVMLHHVWHVLEQLGYTCIHQQGFSLWGSYFYSRVGGCRSPKSVPPFFLWFPHVCFKFPCIDFEI